MIKPDDLHPDCRHFLGHIPCKPHKKHKVKCDDCSFYDPVKEKILIIKLGAIGDVIRSTPILHKLKKEYPKSEIHWLTLSPQVIPQIVDRVYKFSLEHITTLQNLKLDLLINLDKDYEACALASSINAKVKKGFVLKDNRPWPADANAVNKFLTGMFDDLSKQNSKSYPQELFEICGYTFQNETYILDNHEGEYDWPSLDRSKPVIGLNTGCSGRWKSRLWPEQNWIELAHHLQSKFTVILLGGPEEHEKNLNIARKSGAHYPGYFPLAQFINLVNQCDLVVTAVTMAMHITIALNKKIVLFNNTFNKAEFDLYGLGHILEPDFDCDCYYAPECPNNCMQYISVDRVIESCISLLT